MNKVPENNREILEKNILHVSSLEEIDSDYVHGEVEKNEFLCLRGLYEPAEIKTACEEFTAKFDASNDRPARGEDPSEVMGHFQKIAIGGNGQHWIYNPRFMRVVYFPINDRADIYGMRKIFIKLARLRNLLLDKPIDFAIETIEEDMWSASRIQHYPCGGGFIAPHRDAVISKVNQSGGTRRFHQLLLLLTKRGEDFEQGGAWVDTKDGRLDIEEVCGCGDVILYNGLSFHGVDDVDPHLVPDLSSAKGRMIGLVSLYEDMSNNRSAYENYSSEKVIESFE